MLLEGTPWTVTWLAETGSTNADLAGQAAAGAADRTVLVAEHQTAGRGRLDRRWTAPPGSGLLCSILLRGLTRPIDATWAVGMAAVDAVDERFGVAAGLKWPNDVLVGDRKLAGILAEAHGDALVVGIGINVDWPEGFPDDLAATATALNLESDAQPDRSGLLAALLLGVDRWLSAGDDERTEGYRERCVTLGRSVRVDLGDRSVAGTAVDVDVTGRLVVDTGTSLEVITAGDVVHLRPA